MIRDIFENHIQPVQILLLLAEITLKNFHTEVMIQLKKQLEDQTVETHDKTIRPDLINDLHLFQNSTEHGCFRTADRICAGMIQYKKQLLNIGDIFFHKIKRDLQNDRLIGIGTFRRMQDISVDQRTVARDGW